MKNTLAIVCFVKTPELSAMQKQLTNSYGDAFAGELYRRCGVAIQSVLEQAEKNLASTMVYWSSTKQDERARTVWSVFPHLITEETSLSKRMRDVYDQLCDSYERIAFVQVETPQVSIEMFEKALVVAREREAVIGPTRDNGFYLALLPTTLPEAFWESFAESEGAELGRYLEATKLSICWLPQLVSVHSDFDLNLLQEDLINNLVATKAQDELADLLRMRSSLS